MKKIKSVGLAFGVLIASIGQSFCQTNLQFTSVNVTPENAIQLYWTSTNHELYSIQYANALATNADGSTAWNTLYDQYPSHGTNTFVGDFGNYDVTPSIPHPKYMPTRFYRIVDEGADNDTTDNPSILITSPSNGDLLSGQITVTVIATCSNLPIVTTTLYVDGQEMDESDDGSNYVINTCEWPNGPHTLFAVTTARSGMSGPSGVYPIYTSHGVSSYMPVTFSNLISRIAFSQPFFQPSLGQTQEVTASFAANCDWTLQIVDESSNVVRTATGSGNSMTFDWDGTGTGETNIPDGVYYYLISAETNGEYDDEMLSRRSVSSETFDDSSELWAMPIDGSGDAVPFALYPPGFDTNDLTIFSASPSETRIANSSFSKAGHFESADDDSGAAAQASTAPSRPPTSPNKNAVNSYAIAYYSWPTPQSVSIPQNNAEGVCHLSGDQNSSVSFSTIPEAQKMAQNMERVMTKHAWQLAFEKGDQNLPVNSIRRNDQGYGGGEIFTAATIGLFLDHGDYGTDPDYSPGASGSYQTYFRSDADCCDSGWLRMCQFGFGGNLKWMAILACNSLNTYSSMERVGAIPLNTTHMVLGCATEAAVGEDIGALWAQKMFGGFFITPETVMNAWFDAGHDQYHYATNLTSTITFRAAYYPECENDTLQDNTAPTSPSSSPRNLMQTPRQVWP